MAQRIKVQIIDIPNHPFFYFEPNTKYKAIEAEILNKYGVAHKWVSELVEVDDRIPKLKSKIAELKLIIETERRERKELRKENRMLRNRMRKALAYRYFLEDCTGSDLWKRSRPSEDYFEHADREIDGVPEPVILSQEEKDRRLEAWVKRLPPERLRGK